MRFEKGIFGPTPDSGPTTLNQLGFCKACGAGDRCTVLGAKGETIKCSYCGVEESEQPTRPAA